MKPIVRLAIDLASGAVRSRTLVDECLDRIADPAGEGERAFLTVAADRARATADAVDAMRAAGTAPGPYAGIPVAVKDLCDIEGEVSTAGSTVLGDRPPAAADAPVAARLRAAGMVVLGRTNMTEFAYSGLGLNSHYDTPRSPWGREVGHIPGGSSSGTAVAVADGMAAAGLGTDTGGSCRVPAAFCGIVGYKPTARRIPLDGIVPLSFSLDSAGPLARTVECCAIVDDIFAGGPGTDVPAARPPDRMRLAAIQDYVLSDLDDTVAGAYEAGLAALRAAGVEVVEVDFPELDELPTINAKGGLATAEAYHWHRELLASRANQYDQRVRIRIEPGVDVSAADYIDVLLARQRLIGAASSRLGGFDAFVLPTVAIVPPTMASFDDGDPAYYSRTNLLCLRNTSVGNFLDSCSISVPATPPGEPPVGIMLMGRPMDDPNLFSLARTTEAVLANSWG
ncbi:MAG: amidase [Actinomycetia bacterium]|nr:amidase [Actinomycetes bacterium]